MLESFSCRLSTVNSSSTRLPKAAAMAWAVERDTRFPWSARATVFTDKPEAAARAFWVVETFSRMSGFAVALSGTSATPCSSRLR